MKVTDWKVHRIDIPLFPFQNAVYKLILQIQKMKKSFAGSYHNRTPNQAFGNSTLPVGTTFWKIHSHNREGEELCKVLLHFMCKLGCKKQPATGNYQLFSCFTSDLLVYLPVNISYSAPKSALSIWCFYNGKIAYF